MKKLLFIFTIIASTLLSSCNNSNCEITYSSSSCITLGNIGDWGAEIKSHEFNNGLGKITFNGKVTTVPESAFRDCTHVKSITLPNSITSIGFSAFLGCKNLKTIKLPSNLKTIENSAFYDCTSLISITIPNSVTSIGDLAFKNCESLRSVDISDLSAWCKISFDNISSNPLCNGANLYLDGSKLTDITIPSDITEIKAEAFSGCTSLRSVTIPDSVTSIRRSAFSGCTSLRSVTIGNGVTSIGYFAFSDCKNLKSITIPNSVTSIEEFAFTNCESLKSVDISDLSAWCKISFVLYSANPLCNGAKLYLDGSELTDITIPSDITEIKDSAFSGCSSLTSVTIPNSVTSIGHDAFCDCKSLRSVTIGNGVTSIGRSAFYDCTSLRSVTIGKGVTSIESSAFMYCESLKSVYCKPTTPPATDGSIAYNCKIYVPRNSVEAYKSSEYWKLDNIVGYDF